MSNERESMLRPEKKSKVRQRLSFLVGLVLAAFAAFAGVAMAQQSTLTSTVPQSGFSNVFGASAPLTGAQSYTFGPRRSRLASRSTASASR